MDLISTWIFQIPYPPLRGEANAARISAEAIKRRKEHINIQRIVQLFNHSIVQSLVMVFSEAIPLLGKT